MVTSAGPYYGFATPAEAMRWRDEVMRRATPGQLAALQQIARANSFLGTMHGVLPYLTQMEGIRSSYRLGRAQLAQQQQQQEFDRAMRLSQLAGNPFNTVSYLDAMARTGTPIPLNNPIVENIQPMFPTPPGGDRLRDFLSDEAAAFAGGGRYIATEPVVGYGAMTGLPHFTLAERGPEMLEVTPLPGVPQRVGRERQGDIVQMAEGRMPPRGYGTLPPPSRALRGMPEPSGAAARAVRAASRAAPLAAGGKVFGFNTAAEARAFRDATKGASVEQRAALARMAGGVPDKLFNQGGSAVEGQPRNVAPKTIQELWPDWAATIERYGPQALNPFAQNLDTLGRFLGYDTYGNEVYENKTIERGTSARHAGSTAPGPSLGEALRGTGASGGSAAGGTSPSNNAQQAAAKLLAGGLPNLGMNQGFIAALERGEVPGLSEFYSVRPGESPLQLWRRLTPSLRDAYLSLLMSTGQVGSMQDIEAALASGKPSGV